ncbi:MAG: alanine racemase [Pseudomonadota bacterium]|nr:alanine racemase [Pseudomonadota bacterium]
MDSLVKGKIREDMASAQRERAIALMSASNLRHNAKVVKSFAAGAELIAVVKANGFGHGIRSCAKILQDLVYGFGVAHIAEALALREVGIQAPIILLEGVYSQQEMLLAQRYDCEVVCHNEQHVVWLDGLATIKPLQVWVKIDTGMGRLGCRKREISALFSALCEHKNTKKEIRLMSHFACASQPDHPLNVKQQAEFRFWVKKYRAPSSFASSAAIFHFPEAHYQYVRPGLSLYGVSLDSKASPDLRPVMTLKTHVIAIKTFEEGDSIGYDAKYICQRLMRVAVIAVGYGDGYPRDAGSGAAVLIQGVKCPIVGVISMDMMAVDVSLCPNVSLQSPVTLWGEGLPVETVAGLANRSPYELLTAIQHRVKFIWSEGPKEG